MVTDRYMKKVLAVMLYKELLPIDTIAKKADTDVKILRKNLRIMAELGLVEKRPFHEPVPSKRVGGYYTVGWRRLYPRRARL